MQSSAISSLPHRRSGSSLQLGGASRVLASGADASTAEVSTRVRVVARLRPFLADEIKRKEPQCVFVEDKSVLGDRVVKLVESSENSFGEKTCIESQYRFDAAYDASSTQAEIFQREIAPFMPHTLQGHNTTVFCYGMTGTGKTHTMQGSKADPGVIPRCIEALFQQLKGMHAGIIEPAVSLSFLEIYNEKVYDLLDPRDHMELPVRENLNSQVVVANLSEFPVESVDVFASLYAAGVKNRATASTKLNATSSRSHSMLIVRVSYKQTVAPFKRVFGKLHLIDLAGNEDNRVTGNEGKRVAESAKINTSLFVLGKVIAALNTQDSRIPYRDSKLTRLLQDSLGGTNYAVLICNVAPGLRFQLFTARTLAFGVMCRSVNNAPVSHTTAEPMEVDQESQEEDRRLKLEQWRSERESKASGGAAASLKRKASDGNNGTAAGAGTSMGPPAAVFGKGKSVSATSAAATAEASAAKRAKPAPPASGAAAPDNQRLIDLNLLSPYLKKVNALSANPAILHKLERLASEMSQVSALLREQAAVSSSSAVTPTSTASTNPSTSSGQQAAGPRPPCSPISQSAGSKVAHAVVPATPNPDRARAAKESLKQAKQLEKEGRLVEAVALHEQVLDWMKQFEADSQLEVTSKLSKKIASLKARISSQPAQVDAAQEFKTMPRPSMQALPDTPQSVQPVKARKRLRRVEDSSPSSSSNSSGHSQVTGSQEDGDHAGDEDTPVIKKKAKKPVKAKALSVLSPIDVNYSTTAAGDATEALKSEVVKTIQSVYEMELLDRLNSASLKELRKLHTIGEKRASLIFDHRAIKPFKQLDDLRTIGMSDKAIADFFQKNAAALVAK